MFTGFKISLKQNFFNYETAHRPLVYGSSHSPGYDKTGEQIFNEQEERIKTNLNRYLLHNGSLDAAQIEQDWFPQIQADIFISHSHGDELLAKTFAGWLSKNFGVSAFIDSCVWGYADNLLEALDDDYSIKQYNQDGSTTYYYNKTRRSSSHVHMILQGALAKMIDRTECLIFLNTPKSITVEQSVSKTKSPWIYNELLLSSIVQHKALKDYRKNILEKATEMYHFNESADLELEYKASTSHLIPLTEEDLRQWKQKVHQRNPLPWMSMDALYRLKGLLKSPLIKPIYD